MSIWGAVRRAGVLVPVWFVVGTGTAYAAGGLDRVGLSRFLCEALRTGNVPVQIAQMGSGFFGTYEPVPLQESVTPGNGYTTHTFARGFFNNEIRYSYNETTGGADKY